MASGVLSLGFGAFLVYDLGIVKGLFGPHRWWMPR
jgi:hypothetical protein